MAPKNPIKQASDMGLMLRRSILGWTVSVFFAFGGALTAYFFEFSGLITAQLSMGLFGLIGGLFHSLLIRSVGGKISSIQIFLFSLVWALCCLGSVTPLFFTSGTLFKMALLAFYCFAFFGSIGGLATTYLVAAIFDDAAPSDLTSCVIIWSVTFGFATVAGEIVAEGLRFFLPEVIVWFCALITIALIIAIGAGYSLYNQLKVPGHKRPPLFRSMTEPKAATEGNSFLFILVLILLCVPFYLNDFSNIYITDWRVWLLIDYISVKIFPLIIFIRLIYGKKISCSDLGINRQPFVAFATVFIVATMTAVFVDQNGYLVHSYLGGYSHLGVMPVIENPLWRWIDLTLGLLLVGIFEELVYRSYLYFFLIRYTRNPFIIITISAIAFGFIHWSGGANQVIVTSVIGGIFMFLYVKTRSLPAIVLAHFAVNFIGFTDIFPMTVFRFF